MSPLKMGSRQVAALTEELAAHGESLERRPGRRRRRSSTPATSTRRRQIVAKVQARTAARGDHTVVALAGATGSGKSVLFNAIAGQELARSGPTGRPPRLRPRRSGATTRRGELLDWLTVPTSAPTASSPRPRADRRPAGTLDGLVLLDLPDFDSREPGAPRARPSACWRSATCSSG